jgi:hypothetical protein
VLATARAAARYGSTALLRSGGHTHAPIAAGIATTDSHAPQLAWPQRRSLAPLAEQHFICLKLLRLRFARAELTRRRIIDDALRASVRACVISPAPTPASSTLAYAYASRDCRMAAPAAPPDVAAESDDSADAAPADADACDALPDALLLRVFEALPAPSLLVRVRRGCVRLCRA